MVAPRCYERHRPVQSTLYRLVQQHARPSSPRRRMPPVPPVPPVPACQRASVPACQRASVPRFVKDEFDAFLLRGILAHNFLHLRSADCGHDDTA